MRKSKERPEKFKVRYKYMPSKDSEERLTEAFEMIFFKGGKLAPEFKAPVKKGSKGK